MGRPSSDQSDQSPSPAGPGEGTVPNMLISSMPMHHFISAIPFLFLFYVPTATASLNDKDDAFLAFVKDEPNFEAFCKELEGKNKLKIDILSNDYHNKKLDFNQKKDYLIQMFEARLGLMYLMRENWKCAEIRKEIKQEKKECEKLGKYLDILYGYLFRVYAAGTGAAADQIVKPMFILRNKKVGTLIDILEKLSELSRFFFVPDTTKDHAELMLSNEAKLNALNVANLNGTLREQFDQKLKQMLANTKQNEATEGAAFERLNITPVEEDVLFLAFVKDQSNFGQFCQEKGKDLQYIDYGPTYGFTFDQKKEHLVQKYEANLGVLYLMKKYWICENIGKKIKKEKKECEKFSKYLNILYEYLFRVYLEAANQTLSKQLPAD
uniref:Uncharacterized protein n=1 Tax=Globodera rostochiensis TaxID=31243 RepID=A0A914HCQ6_GLORO